MSARRGVTQPGTARVIGGYQREGDYQWPQGSMAVTATAANSSVR
jgi:hypothetical protein